MASAPQASDRDVAMPDWRVTLLNSNRDAQSGYTVVGVGILFSPRRVYTTSDIIGALLGGGSRREFALPLQFGSNETVNVSVQVSRATTDGIGWFNVSPAVDHEPARLATATAGDRVFVSSGTRWVAATVSGELADHTIELELDSSKPPIPGLGAVMDGAGRVVGAVTGWTDSSMIPATRLAELGLGELEHSATPLDRPRHPEPRITRDYPTTDDALSYRRYVEAIAAFLRHKDTKPPLTIGVTGAWGTGKTSLMRMVQEELDPGAGRDEPGGMRFDADSRRKLRRRSGGRDVVTNQEVVRTADRPAKHEPLRAELVDDAPIGDDDWRPTVWFNPWMYQNGDQVWAGLVYAIIDQVTRRLPARDRERFWLRLNLRRTDQEKIHRSFYRILLGRLVPVLLVVLVLAGTAMLVANLLPYAAVAVKYIGLASAMVAVAGGVVRLVQAVWESAATGPFRKLLQPPPVLATVAPDAGGDPGYGGRLGFLHLVQSDMRHVLDLVATDDRPLVVFVDDLDRCSPGTVAQVVEAVNLFLAGEFPHCVFVLAMEPAAVAAHVESAYQDLAVAFAADRQDDGAGIGWRFLDKMIQLPLRLPDPDTGTYLDRLLGNEPRPVEEEETQYEWVTRKTTQAMTLVDSGTPPFIESEERVRRPVPGTGPAAARQRRTELVERLAADIQRRLESAGGVREAAVAAQQAVLERGEPLAPETLEAAERVYAGLYSDQGASEPIRSALPALGTANPRELKRYVNLFRFYTFIAERERLRGAVAPDGEAVAKLAAFVVRWPHLLPAGRTERVVRLARLESVARDSPDEWPDALGAGYPELPAAAGRALRDFLGSGPAIGSDAFRLL